MPLQKIIYKGREIKYKSPADLKKKLNISLVDTTRLILDKNRVKYFYTSSGDLRRFKISDNPLFLQNFGIKRITNKGLLGKKYKIKKTNFISNDIPKNVKLNLKLKIKFHIETQDGIPDNRVIFLTVNDLSSNQLQDYVNKHMEDVYRKIIPYPVIVDKIEVFSQYSNQKFQLVDNKLRDVKPLQLYYENIDTTKYDDCVRDYLYKNYKKLSKKVIKNLGDEKGVSTNELYELCKKYNILMIAYDINKNVIKKFTPLKKNKSFKNLIFIAHNNHLYPLKNKTLHKIKYPTKEIKIIDDADDKIKEFLNKGIEPSDIRTGIHTKNNTDGFIQGFNVGKTTYYENKDYDKCYEILKSFGIEENIKEWTSLRNVADLIHELYKTENINSFFPQCSKFIKGGYGYTKDEPDEEYENVKCIDKNKCYSYCLGELPFLIQLDVRQSTIEKYSEPPVNIIDHYLYIVKVKQSSILLPQSNVYAGYHLKKAKEAGLEFTITESISTNKKENYFKPMIEDIYKKVKNPNDAKLLLNIFIGKFERDEEIKQKQIVDRLCNEEEANSVSGYKRKIKDTDYYIVEKDIDVINIFNQKPISIQVKDYSRCIIYDKIKELKINPDDILKIKTDSITFNDKKNICDALEFGLDFTGWKEEEPKIENTINHITDLEDLSFNLYHNYQSTISEFWDCYAGVGKTYYIINNLIPKLDDYIVLTPSHSTIEDYRKENFNCSVIQKYSLNNKIPKEKNIIIDEVGLCDRNALNVVHKCFLTGKNIYSFGDFKQLLPVMENNTFNNKEYLESTYLKHFKLTENRRNHFTIEYYDKIINGELNPLKEVKKHQTKDFTKAEVVICYRNTTTKIYNEVILKKKGFKDKFQVGVSLICRTNKLRNKNVYNNFILTIKEANKNTFILSDNQTYTKEEIEKYFFPSYARTAYGVQGKSLKSYHYAKEDDIFLKKNGRLAYTIISRLKTK